MLAPIPMPTYLYGLTLTRNALTAATVSGIDGTPARVVPCEDLMAIAATVRTGPTRNVESIRAHDHVLQRFVDAGATVAAARFGQLFSDDGDLCAYVADHAASTRRLLESRDGCVEMRLLLHPNDEPPPVERPTTDAQLTGPGTAYLSALRASTAADPRLSLRPALAPFVLAERVHAIHGGWYAFAHLVRRADLAAYREAVAALPAIAGGRLEGPLPLYSFAVPTEASEETRGSSDR